MKGQAEKPPERREARAQSRPSGQPPRSAGSGRRSDFDQIQADWFTEVNDGSMVLASRERLPLSYYCVCFSALLLLAFGLVMVYSVSTAQGFFGENQDALVRLKQQALAGGVGIAAMLLISRLDYRRWRRPIVWLSFIAFALLVAVEIPGVGREANNATRWIDLGPIPLQPSEVAKLALLGLAAHLLSTKRAEKGRFGVLFWPLAGVSGLFGLLILLQPDLGTALMIGVLVFGLWWQAGMRLREWLGLFALSLGGVAGAILLSDYRRERLLAFLHPFADPAGNGWQIIQSFLAMSSGGWWGVGPGRSVQKFNYLPEAHTDMIFSIIGEEFGFVGVGLVLLGFALLVGCMFRLARRCDDPFGRYLAIGAGLLVGGQAVINLAGVMGVLPLTGIPLPLISFGRTNLVVVLAAVGVALSVARYGPVAVDQRSQPEDLESEYANVAYLDSRRGDGRSRRPSLGNS